MYNSKLLITLKFFERFILYALLGSIVLYMISPGNGNSGNAANSFSVFLNLVYFLPLPVAFASDIFGRSIFLKSGFLILGTGLFLFSSSTIAQSYTIPILVLMAVGFSAIQPNLTSIFFNRIAAQKSAKIIAGIIFFLGITNFSASIGNAFSQLLISIGSFSSIFIILGIISFILLAVLLFTKSNRGSEENLTNLSSAFDIKLILVILALSLVISFGNFFINQSAGLSSENNGLFELLRIAMFLFLIAIASKLKSKNLENLIKRQLVILSVLFGSIFILSPLFISQLTVSTPILIVFKLFIFALNLLMSCLLFFSLFKSFSKKFMSTGMAIMFLITIIPYRLYSFFPAIGGDFPIGLLILLGILSIVIGIFINRYYE